MGKIRVLVASEYQIVRSALRQLLRQDDAFDVLLSECDIGKSLPHSHQTLSPDVLLLELATTASTGLGVPANVLTVMPGARIVLLATNESTAYVRAVFATGVLGYVLKTAAQSDLFQAIKRVYRGRSFLDPRLSESVPDYLLDPMAAASGQSCCKHLSRRELQVLRSIALGFTTKEISTELDLSEKTVQTYRERIHKKLALRSRADLVRYALACGLLG